MTAVYKKELKMSFTNMTGAVAIAVMLLVTGLMFRFYNLYNGVLTLRYTVSNSTLIYYIVTPILSMRVFSEEKRLGTDQLYITSPTPVTAVVLGKYLANVTVLAIPCAVMCLYPLIMTRFGAETLRWDYACILAFFLMGCAYLAVGMFISACTESAVIAAILCILFVFASSMISSIFTIIGASGTASLIFLVVLSALAGIVAYAVIKNVYAALGVFGALAVVLVLLSIFAPSFFTGRNTSVLRVLDFESHFAETAGGTLTLPGILFFVSYIVAGTVLAIAAVKAGRGRRPGVRAGFASLFTTAAILASIVVVNMIVQLIPAGSVMTDLTDEKLYSLTDTTKDLLNSLSEDVDLYIVTDNGQEDEGLDKLLDAYDAFEHVNVERVDAVLHPGFSKKYTDEDISLNSVIAVCGDRSAAADYRNFYVYTQGGGITAYDAEGQVTSAVSRVTTKRELKVYHTVGHDELALGTSVEEALKKAGAESLEVNLLTESVPGDASALIIFSPAQDFTGDEAKKVISYLYGGGHVMIVTMPYLVGGAEMPNLDSVMAAYGIKRKQGMVMEGDPARFVQAPYLTLPYPYESSAVTTGLAGMNIVFPLSEALELPDTDEAPYTVTGLFYTSEQAYLKNDMDTSLAKASGDESGTFVIAACAEQTFSKDSYGTSDIPEDNEEVTEAEEEETPQTRLLYFTTPCAFSPEALSTLIQQQSGLPEGNSVLISRCLEYLTGEERAVSVPTKTLYTPQTVIGSGAVNLIGNLLMIVLPCAVLAAGAAVLIMRRRR